MQKTFAYGTKVVVFYAEVPPAFADVQNAVIRPEWSNLAAEIVQKSAVLLSQSKFFATSIRDFGGRKGGKQNAKFMLSKSQY